MFPLKNCDVMDLDLLVVLDHMKELHHHTPLHLVLNHQHAQPSNHLDFHRDLCITNLFIIVSDES